MAVDSYEYKKRLIEIQESDRTAVALRHVSPLYEVILVFLKDLLQRRDSLATLLCGYDLFGVAVQVIEQNQQIVSVTALPPVSTCFLKASAFNRSSVANARNITIDTA